MGKKSQGKKARKATRPAGTVNIGGQRYPLEGIGLMMSDSVSQALSEQISRGVDAGYRNNVKMEDERTSKDFMEWLMTPLQIYTTSLHTS